MPSIITRGAMSARGFGFGYKSASGDGTKGIFALGNFGGGALTTRNKYTYASCTSTACGVGAASAASYGGSAASWATCVNT